MIQERFDELQPYLRGVKLAGDFTMIESIVKTSWKIDGIVPEGILYKSGKESEEFKGYVGYLFYSENYSLDQLVDTLEQIVSINIEIEQKQALLKNKVEELKKMFENKSLEELKGLKFSSDIDISLSPSSRNKPEPPATKVIKEGENPTPNVSTEKV